MSGETVAARRLGRGARLGIGLGVAGVFAIASFGLFILALTGLDWSSFEELDGSATATVLNVEQRDEYGDLPVDVSFRSEGDRYVGVLIWPADRAEPDVGDKVPVIFDTLSPESTVELDEGQGGGDDGFEAGYQAPVRASQSVPASLSAVDPGPESGNRYAWAWWASLGFGLASVLTVVATAIWATRVPPKPPVYPPGMFYGQPGPYPGPYPPQQYPPQPYPPQQQPRPPGPTPGGYPPPS